MKAPNGKDTNLTERQWLQVRTKAFKDWFGDWINDPANASKVVDENGEPWVVYHGGRKNIDAFREKSDRFEDTYGIYTTDDKIKAGVYAMMEHGDIYSVFLNIKNPKIVNDKSSFHITGEALRQL